MLKILIAAGGTGGHLFPARQLAELLSDCELHFAGHGLGQSPFFSKKYPYTEIASAMSLRQLPTLIKGFFQSVKLMLRFRPNVVVGFGSFHSLPILMAAVILRKKIVLFEPNCTFGKVNRLFVPFAKKIAHFFPLNCKNGTFIPFLPWVKKPDVPEKYSVDSERFTILVFGGSQGAAFINKCFCEAAKGLNFPLRVIHLTGKSDPEIQYLCPSIVKPFEEEMAQAYKVADMVVCRSGAATIAELIVHQKPAVVIPYPYAHNHQRINGQYLGAGVRILDQKEATAERLREEIIELKKNLESHKLALKAITRTNCIDFGHLVRSVGEGR